MNEDKTDIRKTILIYSAGKNDCGSRFRTAVEQEIPYAIKTVCRTLEKFRQTLIENIGAYEVIVLLCATQEEMCFFSLLRDLLCDNRLIIIVPDNHSETIFQAHRFYPRYLSYVDSNFKDVAAVIKKTVNLECATVE